jgi:pimeloyl-ACP methyl ester carboxylesterase
MTDRQFMSARGAAGGLAAVGLLGTRSAVEAQSGRAGRTQSRAVAPVTGGFGEHRVQRGPDQLYVREYPGTEPALVLMHGFPDNLHLYDRLVPQLRGRHLVLFDFLGWGKSDKPEDYGYTFDDQNAELGAVVAALGLSRPVLVGHDASGPAAINWALDHRHEVGGLVLLNTLYDVRSAAVPPEAIAIFADLLEQRTAPLVTPNVPWSFARLAQAIAGDHRMFRWLFQWQVGSFFRDEEVRRIFLPRLYRQFARQPSSIRAFLALNRDLAAAVAANTTRAAELAAFDRPVRIIFGADDPYLNADLARSFHASLPTSELFLVPNARHYVQMDEPAEVARLLSSMPVAE